MEKLLTVSYDEHEFRLYALIARSRSWEQKPTTGGVNDMIIWWVPQCDPTQSKKNPG